MAGTQRAMPGKQLQDWTMDCSSVDNLYKFNPKQSLFAAPILSYQVQSKHHCMTPHTDSSRQFTRLKRGRVRKCRRSAPWAAWILPIRELTGILMDHFKIIPGLVNIQDKARLKEPCKIPLIPTCTLDIHILQTCLMAINRWLWELEARPSERWASMKPIPPTIGEVKRCPPRKMNQSSNTYHNKYNTRAHRGHRSK